MIIILTKRDTNNIYDFISIQLESTSKISNVVKDIRNNSDINNLFSSYDITHIRQAVKFIKKCNDNNQLDESTSKEVLFLMLSPKKTYKIMEKMEYAYLVSEVPSTIISAVANVPNGIGVVASQNVLFDIMNSKPKLFSAKEYGFLRSSSLTRLKTVKKAVALDFSKRTIASVVNGKIDDEQLSNLSSYFTSNSDEKVIQDLVGGQYSKNQISALIKLINTSETQLKENTQAIMNPMNSAEMMTALIKAISLFSDNPDKLAKIMKKLSSCDQNKGLGLLYCFVYGLDDNTINLYLTNSFDSASISQLLLAHANGISGKNMQRLMDAKNYEDRKKLRLQMEGYSENKEIKKSITYKFASEKSEKKNNKVTSSKNRHEVRKLGI